MPQFANMKTDRIFVLLLVVMLPMSGCFDDAVGDAEGAEDTTDGTTTIINNYYNNTTITENIVAENQSKTWYSSGGVFNSQWNMNGVDSNGFFCLEMSTTGNICYNPVRIGTTGGSTPVSAWNTSECTDQGGYTIQNPNSIHNAPTCIIDFATINTSAGEVLMVYEIQGIEINSICGGVSQNAYLESSVEYNIVSGSALTCTHTLSRTLSYDTQSVDDGLPSESHTQNPNPEFWSIVYAIQDVTVV